MEHKCHAFQCKQNVPPKLLMCAKHWRLVPRKIQIQVWKHYRPGQEIDKLPSQDYILIQRCAVWSVYVLEGNCSWQDVPEIGSRKFLIGPATHYATRDTRS
jgi:hypothetical protein